MAPPGPDVKYCCPIMLSAVKTSERVGSSPLLSSQKRGRCEENFCVSSIYLIYCIYMFVLHVGPRAAHRALRLHQGLAPWPTAILCSGGGAWQGWCLSGTVVGWGQILGIRVMCLAVTRGSAPKRHFEGITRCFLPWAPPGTQEEIWKRTGYVWGRGLPLLKDEGRR